MLNEFIEQANQCVSPTVIQLVNAAKWINETPPLPNQILENMLDAGDKLVVIAPSKMRKSFFVLQMALALAAHPKFLGWVIPKQRRVLYVQLEIREGHNWRRVRNLAKSMGISAADIGDRLMIINARGLGLRGADGLNRIRQALADFKPEVVVIDPIYKIAEGVENAAEDFKILLNAFDELAEQTGAAIIFIHHDSKGSPGSKDIRDRGAGSNVLSRDFDACITLTPHAVEAGAIVVDVLLRNYAPQEPFTIVWEQSQETGGYCFDMADDLMADKRTSKTKAVFPGYESYLPMAAAILIGGNELDIAYFKTVFKEKTGLSDSRIRDFINWATLDKNPQMTTREQRGRGINKKWISMTSNEVRHD